MVFIGKNQYYSIILPVNSHPPLFYFKMYTMKYFVSLFLCLILSVFVKAQDTGKSADWSAVNVNGLAKTTQLKEPSSYDLYKLESYQSLFDRLLEAPQRFANDGKAQLLVWLPMADGSMMQFIAMYTPVMEAPLADKYPDIKSYTFISVEKAYIRAKVNLGPTGFHAMIFNPILGTSYIEPFNKDESVYMVYYKKDYPSPDTHFHCDTEQTEGKNRLSKSLAGDCQFREYRLALACTGEYGTFHGGTVASVLAAMNVSMNRVNGIFEEDGGITMILVANNTSIIYLNGATDPYSNGSGGAMLGQNQTTCDNIIGTANYDIGHVFSTGGGGVAYLNAPCNSSIKAGGVTGQGSPVGDPFDVDYVAHEMGHQYGAHHTQNNGCNRSNNFAFEPGSASTIMGYAGICNPNVQTNSDDYFHAASIGSFGAFVTNTSTGGSCDNILSSANTAPTADAGPDYTIPISTPFTLTGIGTDADGDPLTYCWEQYDNEVSAQPPSPTSTVGPNFRSLQPKVSEKRDFPEMGLPNTWEVLPSVSRNMDFRLTVRDYNSTHGYGCTEEDDMRVTTSASAGPFLVTSPDGGEVWGSGTETVTWDVANTDAPPINCSHVDILLSLDGGVNYDIILAQNVPNDGSENITVPGGILANTTARVRIQAVGNIFFDVSNNNFEINSASLSCMTYSSTDVPISIPTSPATIFSDLTIADTNTILSAKVTEITGTHTYVSDLIFTLINPAGDEVILLNRECGSNDDFDMGFADGGAAVSCPLDQALEYDPVGSLSVFNGNQANGLWQLKIEDTENLDGGSLTGWTIELCYQPDCENTLLFDSGTIAGGDYFANQNITALVPADPAVNIWMRSPEINLDSGFEVPAGTTFLVENGNCP